MIIDAYCRIRTIDQTIPDDVLDFMKDAAIEKLLHNSHLSNTLLEACGFSIGQKVQVFDGQKWEKTGDIGDNECFWIEATITGCNVNDYKELLIEVSMVDGRTSRYYKEGVRLKTCNNYKLK